MVDEICLKQKQTIHMDIYHNLIILILAHVIFSNSF